MKNLAVTALGLGIFLGSNVVVNAQNRGFASQKPFIPADKKIVLKPAGKEIGPALNNRKKIGATFRLKLWVNPKRLMDSDATSDSALNVIESYGTLKINGETYWSIPRSQAYQNAVGETFGDEGIYPLSDDTKHNGGRKFEFSLYDSDPASERKLNVSLRLYDSDSRGNDSSKDDLWGSFDYTYDPLKTGPGDWYWIWDSGNGQSSRFNVKIEKIGDIYESNSPGKPQVGPLIEKPLIPGRIPGPGPVIKRVPKLGTQVR